jgi:hypothetical protein
MQRVVINAYAKREFLTSALLAEKKLCIMQTVGLDSRLVRLGSAWPKPSPRNAVVFYSEILNFVKVKVRANQPVHGIGRKSCLFAIALFYREDFALSLNSSKQRLGEMLLAMPRTLPNERCQHCRANGIR